MDPPDVLIGVPPSEATPETLEPHPHPTTEERSKAVTIIANNGLEENAEIKFRQENHADMDTSKAEPSFGGERSSPELKENAEIGPASEPMDPSEAEPSRSEQRSRSKLKAPEETGSTSGVERFQPDTSENAEIGPASEPMDPSEAEPSRSEQRSRSKLKAPEETGSTSGFERFQPDTSKFQIYDLVASGVVEPFDRPGPLFSLSQLSPQGNSALHVAAVYKQAAIAKAIIQRELELVNSVNKNGDLPLHIAARVGCVETSGFLIPDVDITNDQGDTALHDAVRGAHLEVVELLVDNKAHWTSTENNAGESPLFLAVDKWHFDIANKIFSATECSIRGRDSMNVLHAAIIRLGPGHQFSRFRAIKAILYAVLIDPILSAVPFPYFSLYNYTRKSAIDSKHYEKNFKDCVKFVDMVSSTRTSAVSEADKFGLTPFHYAAHYGCLDIFELLLKNAGDSIAYKRDELEGMSAVHIAARNGCVPIVEKLIKKFPDAWELLNDKGRTALHVAAERGKQDVVDYLLKAQGFEGVINKKDKDGNTALHLASIQGNHGILVKLADDNRVDGSAINNKGFTAVDIVHSSSKFTNSEKAYILFRLNDRFGLLTLKEEVRQMKESEDKPVKEIDKAPKEEADSQSNGNGMYKDDMFVVVAALIASVTFGAALQIPGGYKGDDPGRGSAVMIKQLMFNIFVLADCFSFAMSSGSIFVHFWASIEKSSTVAKKFRQDARILTNLSIGGMVVAFAAGVHVALVHSPPLWAASTGLCIFFLWGPMLIFNRITTMIYKKAKDKWHLARIKYQQA